MHGRLIYVAQVLDNLRGEQYYDPKGDYAGRRDCIYKWNGDGYEWLDNPYHGPDAMYDDLGSKDSGYARAHCLISDNFIYFGKDEMKVDVGDHAHLYESMRDVRDRRRVNHGDSDRQGWIDLMNDAQGKYGGKPGEPTHKLKPGAGLLMKAVLVRVGIDGSCGRWQGPCNPHNNEFVYVPIPEDIHKNVPGMERLYSSLVTPALAGFSERNDCNVALPQHLQGGRMHLDPDFEQLSYGDTNNRGAAPGRPRPRRPGGVLRRIAPHTPHSGRQADVCAHRHAQRPIRATGARHTR